MKRDSRKQRSGKQSDSPSDSQPSGNCPVMTPVSWSVGARLIASLLVSLHLLAIFVAPMSVPPASEFTGTFARFFAPYLNLAYLNHGYHFFAPDPGASFLIRYEVETPAGEVIQGTLPDLNEQWPRLLYHRHFMLTSQMEVLNNPEKKIAVEESYLRHLAAKHNAKKVRLEYVRHIPIDRLLYLKENRLDHPNSYSVVKTAEMMPDGSVKVIMIPPPEMQPPEQVFPEQVESTPAADVPIPFVSPEANNGRQSNLPENVYPEPTESVVPEAVQP